MTVSSKQKRKNPSFILVIGYLLTPGCSSFLATIINEYRRQIEAPEWITYARIILVALTFFFIAYAFFSEQQIRTKKLEKIRKKGRNPEAAIFIIGSAYFMYPGFIAFFIFILGGTIADVYLFSAVSFIGVLVWSWRQRAIFKRPISKKEAARPMVRAYTIIIIIIGVLSLIAGFLEAFVMLSTTEDSKVLSAVYIFSISIYVFFAIWCWITAILRVRRSPYALATTGAISPIFLFGFPFGTAAFIYWIGWVRKKERQLQGKTS
jgi:MFS family permease